MGIKGCRDSKVDCLRDLAPDFAERVLVDRASTDFVSANARFGILISQCPRR